MNHPAEAILFDMLARPDGVTDDVRRHLARCSVCQQRLDELRLVHDLLGDTPGVDEVEAVAGVDLWPALKQRIEAVPEPAIVRQAQSWWASGTTWRAAALVMLSIGIGHLTARIAADSNTTTTTTTFTTAGQTDATTVASAEDLVAADLYLDRFTAASPLGLSSIVLTDSADTAGEVSP